MEQKLKKKAIKVFLGKEVTETQTGEELHLGLQEAEDFSTLLMCFIHSISTVLYIHVCL